MVGYGDCGSALPFAALPGAWACQRWQAHCWGAQTMGRTEHRFTDRQSLEPNSETSTIHIIYIRHFSIICAISILVDCFLLLNDFAVFGDEFQLQLEVMPRSDSLFLFHLHVPFDSIFVKDNEEMFLMKNGTQFAAQHCNIILKLINFISPKAVLNF